VQQGSQPEFSRRVGWERVREAPIDLHVEATAEERQALATRFDLLALDRLSADITFRRLDANRVRCQGRWRAELAQACVVTLEPVQQVMDEPFEVVFSRHMAADDEVVEIDSEDLAEYEPLSGGEMDVGESIAQQLAVSLDPYPRLPGAAWQAGEQPTQEADSPFASLAKVRTGR
jgi:uncharacterized metal-binding protein YceD (DUF177 family)